ncbi:MAG: DUF222 domain-containing protein [Nesterenkonia sp.]|nr:DUF222 domain-containing protein [Nesterenkonia sp.]
MAQSEHRRAGLPDRDAPHLDALQAAAVDARQAEARSWAAMIAHQDAQERRFAAGGLTGPALAVARSTVAGDVARVLNCSERYAASALSTARQVRQDLPDTWSAFRRGLVERIAVTRIAEAAALLTADTGVTDLEVLAAFDAEASAAAARIPLSRLGPWMRRYIARAAPEAADRRARRSRADRWVRVTHDDDGMSLLEARLPTLTAAAIARRLSAVARSADSPVPHQDERGRALDGAQDPSDVPETRAGGDPRTLDQREADLLGAWLLSGRIDGVEVDAKIAVMIPEATLIGDSQAPGIAADGSFTVPAEDARRLALRGLSGGHDWYEARCRPRTVSGPASDGLGPTGTEADLLSVVSTGRAPSKRVRDALIFRDGTCRAPGCGVPAERCDLDHQIPHPEGPTAAHNLWALCRRHHRMKSHGYLTPPEPAPPPDEQAQESSSPQHAPRSMLPGRRHGAVDLLWAVPPHDRRSRRAS